jgi:hypothetical protein
MGPKFPLSPCPYHDHRDKQYEASAYPHWDGSGESGLGEQGQYEQRQQIEGQRKEPLRALGHSQSPLFCGRQAIYDHCEDDSDKVEANPKYWTIPKAA